MLIKALVELANKCDADSLFEEADILDRLATQISAEPLLKLAGAEKHRELPIIASTVIFRRTKAGLEVLLEKRKKDPQAHKWALPGGHVEKDDTETEDFSDAASRELKEETGISISPKDLTFVTCKPRTIGKAKLDMAFMGHVSASGGNIKAGSDAEEVHWVPVTEIPSLAFDHNYFLEVALKRYNDTPHFGDIDISDMHSQTRSNRGTLIVFEGLDGAGKTSQIEALYSYLSENDFKVKKTKWASSDLIKKTIKSAKEEYIPPELYSLLHMTDMHERYWHEILPWLAQDYIVLCDRYIYTSFARDVARGVDPALLKASYQGFVKPDLVIWCDCPPQVTTKRLTARGETLGYYGSGQDLHLDSDPVDNLLKYQNLVHKVYKQILPQVGAKKIDSSKKKSAVTKDVIKIVDRLPKLAT